MNQMYDTGPNKNYAFAVVLLVCFIAMVVGAGYGLYRLAVAW